MGYRDDDDDPTSNQPDNPQEYFHNEETEPKYRQAYQSDNAQSYFSDER